jgi:hypothetical protein
MGRTATKRSLATNLLERQDEIRETVLILPPCHTIYQRQLVYAWELRYDPITDPHKKNADYLPHDPEWQKLPLAHPKLRIVVGACGTKRSSPLSKSIAI